ncbi:helix-turn-helix domain-containing protein [Pediococcus pentosaceus]|nr:helix-turn-helix transcriptional regulator [Pediococcus pentosaceus]
MLLKIKKFKPIEPKQALSRNNIINSAIELMEHNSSLSISEIAQFTNTSTAYFSRIFKKIIGETPVCFYTKIKLKKVQKLLITTNLTLAEISEQTGFTDPFYLSKVFTTHLGCSPRTYRKNHII